MTTRFLSLAVLTLFGSLRNERLCICTVLHCARHSEVLPSWLGTVCSQTWDLCRRVWRNCGSSWRALVRSSARSRWRCLEAACYSSERTTRGLPIMVGDITLRVCATLEVRTTLARIGQTFLHDKASRPTIVMIYLSDPTANSTTQASSFRIVVVKQRASWFFPLHPRSRIIIATESRLPCNAYWRATASVSAIKFSFGKWSLIPKYALLLLMGHSFALLPI